MEEQDSDRPTEAMAAMFLDDQAPAAADDEKTTAAQPIVSPGDEGGDTTATVTLAGDHLAPGMMVGGYAIEAELASGGVSDVYAAVHPVIGKRVAIKVLRADLCGDPVAVDRFITEARAANAIRHPNIIDIFDLGALPDGRQYLVMDLLEGEALRKLLAKGPLAVGDASSILADLASALGAAHAKNIVHRDLKPDNVFVARKVPRPEVKLLDFGVAKLLAVTPLGLRTRTGALIGTVGYMSPEQGRGKNVDHRTDIYALGVTAFEMLAGRLPFNHANPMDLLIAHETAPVPSLRQVAPDVPPQLAQVVEAMMSKRPDDRPTLEQVRLVVKRLRTHTPTAVTAQSGTTLSRGSAPAPPASTPSTSRGSHPVIRPARPVAPPTLEDTGFDHETTSSLRDLANSPTEHAGQAYRTGVLDVPASEKPTLGDRPELMRGLEEPETETNELLRLDEIAAYGGRSSSPPTPSPTDRAVETTFPRAGGAKRHPPYHDPGGVGRTTRPGVVPDGGGAEPPLPPAYAPGRMPAQVAQAAYAPPPSYPPAGPASAAHAMHAIPAYQSVPPPDAAHVHGGHGAYRQPMPAPVDDTGDDGGGTRWVVIALIAVLVSSLGVILALAV